MTSFIVPLNDCAPHIKMVAPNICSTSETLTKLKGWLQTSTRAPEKIIQEAEEKTGCDSEVCLAKKLPNILTESELDERFKKEGPRNTTAWLSNEDIDESVLNDYKKMFA